MKRPARWIEASIRIFLVICWPLMATVLKIVFVLFAIVYWPLFLAPQFFDPWKETTNG